MKYLYGIQPTGRLHIGNYLGGLKLAIEKRADILIADYHAMTTTDVKVIDVMMYEVEKQLMDLGALDTDFQHPYHTELSWHIQCITPVSDLERMTQWKDKGKGNAGLLTYPCLMAADIILSGCDAVIVGEDQVQHMEFYRRTCKRLGIKKIAKTVLTETPRIMSIKDPSKKMSKSLGDEHCLYLGDHEANRKKIMKAPTTPAGVKNLKQIAKGLGIEYDAKNNKASKERLADSLERI